MSYVVNLEKFYGPLDLLLYLLEKEEIDIYDIPVALITDQYLEYIHTTGQIDLDNIGDFLSMASYLLNLKSRLLLPGLEPEDDEIKCGDPRDELVDRILKYKQYKLLGEYLASRYDDNRYKVFFRDGQTEIEGVDREVRSSLNALVNAWYLVMDRNAELPTYNLPEGIDIGSKMKDLLRILPEDGSKVIFQDIYAGIDDRGIALAYFLALLELIRLKKVVAGQACCFGDIEIIRVAVNNVDAG
jgi:segregation and condensation protein A